MGMPENQVKRPRRRIGCLTIVGIIVLLFVANAIYNSTGRPSKPAPATAPASSPAPSSAQVTRAATPQQQTESVVRGKLLGNNNRGQPFLRSVQVEKADKGGWAVYVEFNAADNLTHRPSFVAASR